MKAGFRRTIALTLGLCALTIPASAASTFSDVPSSYWGYSYITEAASKGLVSGIGNGQYGPEQKLSNAQFVTMVCNMFYSDLVKAQGTSADWWRPYMNVAQAVGLLNGTTAGSQYAASGSFTAANANGQISRYDMAQIMYNVSTLQRWETPDSMSLVLSQLLIQDFSTIPTSYQMAVAYCYAKGFLSGDENGNFNGSSTTTRAQAAVVLCSLNKAKTQVTAPTYSNTNRLANGLAATEENVADLVDDLWAQYPDYDQWNVDTTYTSQRLGTASGSKGFAYMLSDKIFGGMRAAQIDDPQDLRIGDLISLNSGSEYGVVCEADEDTFTYVSCDSSGWISWKNDMYRDDLDKYDTVWTRYLELPEPDDVLANGKEATRANVEDLLDDLRDNRNYGDGKWWDLDDESDSEVLGEYRGVRGFVYQLSDEIFGNLEDNEVDDVEDMRVGDIIYDDWYEVYGLVVSVNYNKETYTFVSIDLDTEDDDGEAKIDWDFDSDFAYVDEIYTRYPEDADYDWDDDDVLTNGKDITTTNVRKLLNTVLDDVKYDYENYWDTEEKYNSNVFGSKNYEDEAFAYYISDEVFGYRDYDYVDYADELRVGDVIYDNDAERYAVVLSIDEDDETCDYVSINKSGKIVESWCDFDDIDDEIMYTRY